MKDQVIDALEKAFDHALDCMINETTSDSLRIVYSDVCRNLLVMRDNLKTMV